MFEASTLIPFVVASAVLVLIPGPAVLYIVSTGIGRGRRMAMASMLGIETGTLFHIGAAAVGLSAVVANSVLAYSVVKYVGAGYLVYLGIKTLRERDDGSAFNIPGATTARGAFRRGVVVNVLNPKVALFFLAFLPQFVVPARGSIPSQLVLLGLLFVGVAIVIDGIYAMTSGTIGTFLTRNARTARAQKKIAGVAYLALGASAAVTGSNSK